MAEDFNEDFNVDEFIAGLQRDKSKEYSPDNVLVKVMMNQRDHQGTVTIVPFISKNVGNIYSKLEGVKEWYGYTSLLDSGEGWFKILPLKFYKDITPTQIELYNEVVSLFDACNETGKFGYNEAGVLRVRNYSLFTGVCLKHTNTEGKSIEDNINKACLFIFPSNAPIDALQTCISSKAELLGPKTTEFIRRIITPSLTNRGGVVQISFKKSSSPGYDSSVNFETNTEFNTVIDPTKEFSKELASLFDDPIKTFLGWMYDYDNKKYFNETYFVELRDNLRDALNPTPQPQEEPKEENKNGNIDPMTTPIPSVDATAAQGTQETQTKSGGYKPPF
jgi:hypothetical protein